MKQRILYVHHERGLGGAPLSLLYLLQKLDRARYEPSVLCLYDSEAADLYRREGVPTFVETSIRDFSHTTLDWYDLRRPWRLLSRTLRFWPSALNTRAFLRRHMPDLVHLNSSTLAPCAIAASGLGIPVVWHIREPLHDGYLGLRKFLLRQCIHHCADRVICISEYDARRLLPDGKVRVVPNFVDFTRFDRTLSGETFRREFGLGRSKVVGMLGGVLEPKGTLEFVQALPRVIREVPNSKFVVVGAEGVRCTSCDVRRTSNVEPRTSYVEPRAARGQRWLRRISGSQDYSTRVQRWIDANNLREHTIFTGVRQDIPQVIAALDLLVFPSTVPHFARPIIEAGALAKPVVASNLGGPAELVEDGVTGLLVPPRDSDALAQAIVKILQDDDLARRMGEIGYERARRLYNSDVNAQRIFDVYDELLE